MKRYVYRCAACGGTNIEISAWVDPNDGFALVEGDGPIDGCWCRDCEGDYQQYTCLYEEPDAA